MLPLCAVTVAVKVTGSPYGAEASDELTVVVVGVTIAPVVLLTNETA